MRTLAEWLADIRNAITNLEEAKGYGRERFDTDKYVQVWMIYHIAIIGEAARAIESDVQAQYPDIDWSAMIGMRNILVHQYFRTDLDIVWDVASNNLATLKE